VTSELHEWSIDWLTSTQRSATVIRTSPRPGSSKSDFVAIWLAAVRWKPDSLPERTIEYHSHDGTDAAGLVDEVSRVYSQSFGVPPHSYGERETAVFRERYPGFCSAPGFSLVTARRLGQLVGFAYGFTLPPTTRWWSGVLTPVPESVATEYPGRTFALIDLAVLPAWHRQGIATKIHDRLLEARGEERATLTVRVEAADARAAYSKWGWTQVGQKRNPMPGNPLVDVMLKPLR
jgi:ribosomal protein S18 acetylase RimI-like enzyme